MQSSPFVLKLKASRVAIVLLLVSPFAHATGGDRGGSSGPSFEASVMNPSGSREAGKISHGERFRKGGAPRQGTASRSLGSPTHGKLVGAAALRENEALRICPEHAVVDARWGLDVLVSMLHRAAAQVRKKFRGSTLNVGDLSRAGGGPIEKHRSHESGRDADVGFYVKGVRGNPLLADRFVPFRGDGSAPTWPGAFFDDERNWAFVASILTDPKARVSNIFVAAPLRDRLLAEGARQRAPLELRIKAAQVMMQPRGVLPHDDHFHVRIACPSGMRDCQEKPGNLEGAVAQGRSRSKRVRGHAVVHRSEGTKGKVLPVVAEGPSKGDGTTPAPKTASATGSTNGARTAAPPALRADVTVPEAAVLEDRGDRGRWSAQGPRAHDIQEADSPSMDPLMDDVDGEDVGERGHDDD